MTRRPKARAGNDQPVDDHPWAISTANFIVYSDHLELSEQFDAMTGYEKSVSNLSWSYASFLSAVRAR